LQTSFYIVLIGGIITIFVGVNSLSNEPDSGSSPAAEEIEPADETIAPEQTTPDPIPAATLSSFRFITGIMANSMGRDKTVDGQPPRYQMWAGTLSISYSWAGVMSDGTEAGGTGCAMNVSISGPANIPAITDNQCSPTYISAYNSAGHRLDLTVPGDYTLTATDSITGATGSTVISVEEDPPFGT
jgi:hypothetical protein